MSKAILHYVSTIACWLIFSCCQKDKEPDIPPPSTTGANIMIFKVNGEQRVYTGTPNSIDVAGVSFTASQSVTDSTLYISGSETDDYNDYLAITLNRKNIELNKYYTLSEEKKKSFGNYRKDTGYDNDSYHTANESGFIIFTRFDNGIASGTFKFTAYNPSGAKIEITDGYFDIKN